MRAHLHPESCSTPRQLHCTRELKSKTIRSVSVSVIFGKLSGPEKGVITKGVFSLEESLESLKSLKSLESLQNGRLLLYFPESGGSLKFLESLNSLESLEMDFSEKTPFPKDPFSEPEVNSKMHLRRK